MKWLDVIKLSLNVAVLLISVSIGFGRMEGRLDTMQHNIDTLQVQQAQILEQIGGKRG